jgi:hypothetical protein
VRCKKKSWGNGEERIWRDDKEGGGRTSTHLFEPDYRSRRFVHACLSSRQEKRSGACRSELVTSEDVYTERTSKIIYSSSVHKSGERSLTDKKHSPINRVSFWGQYFTILNKRRMDAPAEPHCPCTLYSEWCRSPWLLGPRVLCILVSLTACFLCQCVC